MLRKEEYVIRGAGLEEEDPLPFFRDPAVDRSVAVDDEVPRSKREYLGKECTFRILPYRMQDNYSRSKGLIRFNSIILENEKLRAIFLPEVGGRLVSLFDKDGGRELLSRNPVFQPANLANRNAWFSGGIEWNVGHYGHAFHTCSPIFAARVPGDPDDAGILRLYDFERQTGLFWQIDFRLPPGSPLLYASVRVVNPLDRESSFYWWTNIAVPEAEGVRVLAPARYALYIDPTDYAGHRFGWAALPRLPSLSGADGTYSLNSKFSNEFFFQCEESTMPWETALDGAGRGFFECSTHPLSYRKIFCWGSHRGGRHWQEFLAEPGVVYLEIQGGVAPSQLHGASLGAGSSTSWTQAFGALDVGGEAAGIVHGEDWAAAVGACDAAICKLADPQRLAAIHRRFESTDDAEVAEILALGSGWGALEKARYAAASRDSLPRNAVPAGLAFPDSTIGSEQRPWLELLETGRLPRAPAEVAPGAFVTSPEWRRLLEKSLDMPGGAHWRSLYHVGVMRLEALDESGAEIAWNASIAERSSAWAMRNLAILAARRGDKTKALDLFGKAWGIELIASRSSKRPLCGALAAENLAALIESGKMQDAIDFVGTLPAIIANCDRIRLLRAKGLLALGKLDEAEAALDHDFAVIREGQNDLTDLWFEIKARRLSEERLVEVDEPIRAEAKRLVPPERLDFRMEGPTDTGLVSSERPSPLPFG